MKYENLHDLLSHSSSTMEYFLSLPVSTQLALHEYSTLIHTAAELHFFCSMLGRVFVSRS